MSGQKIPSECQKFEDLLNRLREGALILDEDCRFLDFHLDTCHGIHTDVRANAYEAREKELGLPKGSYERYLFGKLRAALGVRLGLRHPTDTN